MEYPEEDAERIFQTLIIGIAFIVGAAVTFAITGATILDNDPTSYIIVTMLMGTMFIFFTLKDKAKVTKGGYGIIGAVLAFVVYLVILSYSRGLLSFEFLSYRVDALLLPLLLMSIVMAVAGIKGIRRYASVMAYLLFASPILLLSIINSNSRLASFSAGIVYSVLKLLGTSVTQLGQQIIAPSGQAITIASTCVPVGTFIAFIMLLLPIAYLYTGNPTRKTAWLATGVLMLFVLNVIRMIILAFAWMYTGISGAVLVFHSFGGNLIFYIALVTMLLTYKKFGLKLELGREWIKRLKRAFGTYDIEENYGAIASVAIIALAALLLSLPYLSSSNVSAAMFTGAPIPNSTYDLLFQSVLSRVNASGVPYVYEGNYQGTMFFELGKNRPYNSTYMIVSFYPHTEHGANVAFYSSKPQQTFYILNPGITVTSFSATSNDTPFYINYFAVPIVAGGSAYSANFELFSPAGAPGLQYCNPAESSGIPEYIESSIYNILSTGSPQHGPVLCSTEKIALS
ncbi:MAG: exosortase/archaeosortase family protein [Candidatus Micrarchaeota archaeon]|nr:exosortase/archaeosortase family protein [Candidatus Micrarchaeota archaeon]